MNVTELSKKLRVSRGFIYKRLKTDEEFRSCVVKNKKYFYFDLELIKKWYEPKNKINEIWIDIPNYDGLYQVSNLGRVKSLQYGKERILKPNRNKYGYLMQAITKNKKLKLCTIHRLMMLSFKPDEYFEGAEVNHRNGIKDDNRLENLEWCTSSENQKHAYIMGLQKPQSGYKNGMAKLTQEIINKIRTEYKTENITQKNLALKYNISRSHVSGIITNKYWKTKKDNLC